MEFGLASFPRRVDFASTLKKKKQHINFSSQIDMKYAWKCEDIPLVLGLSCYVPDEGEDS